MKEISPLAFGLSDASSPPGFIASRALLILICINYRWNRAFNPESFSGNPEGRRFRSGMKESQGFSSKTAMAFQDVYSADSGKARSLIGSRTNMESTLKKEADLDISTIKAGVFGKNQRSNPG